MNMMNSEYVSVTSQRIGASTRWPLAMLMAALLAVSSGCATDGGTVPGSGGGMSGSSQSEQQLEEAAAHYRQGDYAAAIKRLQSAPDIWSDNVDVRVRAHKLLAFSYCVTNQRTQCRQQFTRILELAPAFELSPAEAGHPIWGSEFREAKRLRGSKP